MNLLKSAVLVSVALLFVSFAGCGDEAATPKADANSAANDTPENHPTHGGWWCYEHGIPEENCAMCNSELASTMRADGDWCDEHNRPESICFKCDPSRADEYIALYEAKYGEKPPAAQD